MVNTDLTYDSTSRFVETPGWKLHYHEAGEGHPVLFLHGSGPGATAWSNFHSNIGAFSDHFRVLLLDQPGWGESSPMEDAEGGHRQAIIEFLDALELEKVSLVGNSLGGINALEIAMTTPERVANLITMGAPDLTIPNFFSPAGFSLGLQAVYRGFTDRTFEVYKNLIDVMTFDDRFLTDEFVQQRLDDALKHPHHLDAFVARAAQPRAGAVNWDAQKLAALEHPTLLVHGRDDQVVPYEGTLRLLTMIPNSRAVLFNQCGHWAQVEKADEFNRVVIDFLQTNS